MDYYRTAPAWDGTGLRLIAALIALNSEEA